MLENKHVFLINNCSDTEGSGPYTNLGAIYRDAIKAIPPQAEIICFCDDDDIYLENHFTEGVKGFLKAKQQGKLAYKPAQTYYFHDQIALVSNTMEPSFFVDANHIKQYGFHLTTANQHIKWVEALEDRVLVDNTGTPTYVYTWGNQIPTFKTSGDPGNPNNFLRYKNFSQDHGDGKVTPAPYSKVMEVYRKVNEFQKIQEPTQ